MPKESRLRLLLSSGSGKATPECPLSRSMTNPKVRDCLGPARVLPCSAHLLEQIVPRLLMQLLDQRELVLRLGLAA